MHQFVLARYQNVRNYMVKLTLTELEFSLNPELNDKSKQRVMIAFRSLGYQEDYCRYHYEQFHKEYDLFVSAFHNDSGKTNEISPQFFRIAFEANVFSFFRALHALIESIPYLMNIVLEMDAIESTNVKWYTVRQQCESMGYLNCAEAIKTLRTSFSYKELEHLVNVSKHRRIPRVDSGSFMRDNRPRLMQEDLDIEFRSCDIKILMEVIFDELHPKALEVIHLLIESRKSEERS